MEKRRWVRLRVPASTANLGAGFDALGMALGARLLGAAEALGIKEGAIAVA